MSVGVEIVDFEPSIKAESYFASHHFKVNDVIRFAEVCAEAVEAGLDQSAPIQFDRSSTGHVVRLWAKSGGNGTPRPRGGEDE